MRRELLNIVNYAGRRTRTLQGQSLALQKSDKTVVTEVDYFVQSLLTSHLGEIDASTPILAEETNQELQSIPALREAVNQLLRQANISEDVEALLARATHTISSTHDYWLMDPIDGTRGFVRGDQYAIALSKLVGALPVHSFLCCPRLVWNGISGVTLVADGDNLLISDVNTSDVAEVFDSHSTHSGLPRLVESLELGDKQTRLRSHLVDQEQVGVETVRMDSQAKYASLVLGMSEVYLRQPSPNRLECSWDHAAGAHLVHLAGGRVTDFFGCPLDYSTGAYLRNNRGVLATIRADHDKILASLKLIQD